jgi:hypothetical protein
MSERLASAMKHASNCAAWALGTQMSNGFHIRRVVWGLLLAHEEKREGEEIRACTVLVEKFYKRRSKPQ